MVDAQDQGPTGQFEDTFAAHQLHRPPASWRLKASLNSKTTRSAISTRDMRIGLIWEASPSVRAYNPFFIFANVCAFIQSNSCSAQPWFPNQPRRALRIASNPLAGFGSGTTGEKSTVRLPSLKM